jgi:uncharacterized protein
MSLKEHLANHLVSCTVQHPWRTLLVFIIITGVLLVGVFQLQLDATFKGFLGSQAESYQAYETVMKEFSFNHNVMIAFWKKEGMEGTLDEYMDMAGSLRTNIMEQLGSEGRGDYKNTVKRVMYSPTWSYSESDFVKRSQQKLRELRTSQDQFVPHPQWDKPMFIMEVLPDVSTEDMIQAILFMPALESIIESFRSLHPNYEFVLGGFPVIAKEEGDSVLENLMVITILVLIGIALLFIAMFRRISFIFITLIPLALGIVWSLGLLGFLVGRVNIMSAMSPVILYGIGISYAIHMGVRYTETKSQHPRGTEPAVLMKHTFLSISGGLLIGSITTAGAFLSLLVCFVSGFSEFGLVSAIGVLAAMVNVYYLLPLLLLWQDKRLAVKAERFEQLQQQAPDSHSQKRWNQKRDRAMHYLPQRPFNRLGKFASTRFGWIILICFILGTIFFAFWIHDVNLEENAMAIMPDDLDSIQLEHRMEYVYGFSNHMTLAMIRAENGEQLKEKIIKIRRFIMGNEGDQREGEPLWAGLDSINIEYVVDLVGMGLSNKFRRVGWQYDPDTWNQAKADLKKGVGAGFGGKMSDEEIQQLDLLISSTLKKESDGSLLNVLTIFPSQYVWNEAYLNRHHEDLQSLASTFDITIAGLVPIWAAIKHHMFYDIQLAMFIALGIVILFLLGLQRSFRGFIITFVVVAGALIVSIGFMGITGMKLNIMNIVAFPLILGLGIDYAVMLFQHLTYHEFKNMEKTIAFTGKAIFTAALTDLIAIGSFIFTSHPGMHQFGSILSLGIAVALTGSLFVVPQLVKLLYRNSNRS